MVLKALKCSVLISWNEESTSYKRKKMIMNHKQKLGYMALGAGILALGIIIGQFVTPDIEAQNNGVFDQVYCKGLTIVDNSGNPRITLNVDGGEKRANIAIWGKNKKTAAYLGSSEDGSLFVLNFLSGESGVTLSVFEELGAGNISLSNKADDKIWGAP